MVREPVRIDISPTLNLADLARGVRRTQTPVVLQDKGEDVAVLSPARPRRRRQVSPVAGRSSPRRRTVAIAADDPLLRHIGSSHSNVPDVSSNKHRYLADAYQRKGRGQTP